MSREALKADKRFMTVGEAASFLRCSKSNIYKYSHLREIPLYKFGKTLLFSDMELAKWLSYGANKAAAARVIAERDIASILKM